MVNMEWIDQFIDSKAEFLLPGASDHSPGIATIFEKRKHGPPPFRFFNYMTEEPDFLDLIRRVWSVKVKGIPMYVFMTKLRKVKVFFLIYWKRIRFKNLFEQVMEAKKEMTLIQQQVQVHPLCPVLARKEKKAVQQYAKISRYEESMKKQKSRVQWLDLGDSNTHFFHNSLKERRSRNNILTLTSRDGKEDTNGQLIEDLHFDKVIDDTSKEALIRSITRDEIVQALASIGSGKSPGPYGFSSHFFKYCWTIIGDDFVAAVKNVFKSSKLLKEVNNTFVTLVAKNENPSGIVDYRPIACCGVVYKCISKIISLRMKLLLKHLIHPCQSAFIAGRSIQDNSLVAHEIVRNYHRTTGTPRFTMKIDLRKSYETVSWKGILITLKKMGFPAIFIGWIELCITSPKFMFLLLGLHMATLELEEDSDKDDVLVFFKGTTNSVATLRRVSWNFSACSGLQMNQQKISLFASAVGDDELQNILHIMEYLEDKFSVRLTLIKHVLSGMVFFWLSCFILSKRAIKEITNIFKRFLWDGCELGKKHCRISWSTICFTYNEGGLGVRDIEVNTLYVNTKHLWDHASGKDSIWTDWVKKNIIQTRNIWEMHIPSDSSWCWRRGLDQRQIARDMVITILGDGANTRFLHDNWHYKGRLSSWMDPSIISEFLPNDACTVSDFVKNDEWSLPSSTDHSIAAIFLQVTSTDFLTLKKDKVMWSVSNSGVFSVKDTYNSLFPHGEKVKWSTLVWFKLHIPRHSFITWVSLHGILKTRDKLLKWNVIAASSCLFCAATEENEGHMFHACEFAIQIWRGLLIKMGYHRELYNTWQEEIQWCIDEFKGYSCVVLIKKMIFNSFIYNIWRERNSRIFESKYNSLESVSYQLVQEVWLKLSAHHLKDADSAANMVFMERWRVNCEFILKQPILCAWVAPTGYDVMINTDGSMSEAGAGFGAIIRDSLGNHLIAAIG
ncbi:uncharacterized protein LOC113333864 [Papaver somniferum]|uniref:uncharacterized protein LOC113333864 n=1 Tax=Papaver somniferum TaxID=3469 RepID=UPI000E6FCE6B|nr:uncharacterized protein LOC113333864 [Papaver somniferum]